MNNVNTMNIYQCLILLSLISLGASTLATQHCNPDNGKCYHAETDSSLKKNWWSSVAECKANGWRLAEGLTGDDVVYINSLISQDTYLNVVQNRWITIYYGEEVFSSSNWWQNSPDTSKECASINNNGLESKDCNGDTLRYICEKQGSCSGTSCYKLYSDEVTWREAFDQCATLGYHLVDIGDDTEFNFIVGSLSLGNLHWVGLKYHSDFGWPYSVVISDESDSSIWGGIGGDDCARLRFSSGWPMALLDDRSCDKTYLYICEEITTLTQPTTPCEDEAAAGNSDGWFDHDGTAEYCLIYDEESSTDMAQSAIGWAASDTSGSYTTDKLIDGIIDDENSMFSTGTVSNPWIQIDLGTYASIQEIHLILQYYDSCITDCYNSLDGGIITIGNDSSTTDLDNSGTSPNTQCGAAITTDYNTYPDTAIRGILYTHDCGFTIIGQYITLVVAGSNKNLKIREIYIYPYQTTGVSASSAIGVSSSSSIENSQMLASSYRSDDSIADYGRLDSTSGYGAWRADDNDADPWLQVDMLAQTLVSGVSTQWNDDGNKGVTEYKVAKSYDGISFTDISVGGSTTLSGSSNGNSAVQVNFDDIVLTRFIRFIPTDYRSRIAMRVEIYGYYKSKDYCDEWRRGSYASLGSSNAKYWLNFGETPTPGFCCVTPEALFSTKGDSWFVFTSSSEDASYPATQVSANTPGQEGCWKPSNSDNSNPWVEIELEAMSAVESIEIVPNDGAGVGYYVVHEYTVKYSVDGSTYNWVQDSDGNTRTFFGNTYGEVSNIEHFAPTIFARFFRIYPTPDHSFEVEWDAGNSVYTVKSSSIRSICMKIELHGCAQSASSCDDWMMITGNQAGRYLVNDVATDCGKYIGSSRFLFQ